jgi:CysZ protein
MPSFLIPLVRAIQQLGDRILVGVVIQSVAWSVACFVLLHLAAIWAVHHLVALHGPWLWVVDVLGVLAASLLAFWLFIPIAAAIGSLYFDRIAAAVEHRWYPDAPPPHGATLWAQIWDGLALGLRVLWLNVLALLAVLLLPGIGLILGWLIAAYALGRGLFVAVAMRRMPRPAAESLYLACRPTVLLQGGLLAIAAYVPLINLLLPVVGVATMVHTLDMALARFNPRSDVAWRA